MLPRIATHPGRAPSMADQSLAAYASKLLDSAERGERQDVAAALADWAEHSASRRVAATVELIWVYWRMDKLNPDFHIQAGNLERTYAMAISLKDPRFHLTNEMKQ